QPLLVLAQFGLCSTALDGRAGAVGDLTNEHEFVLGPGARLGVVEIQKGYEAPLLRYRHVDERLGADALEVVGRLASTRILIGVRHDHGLAALEFVDVAAVVAEMQQAGEAADAGRVPVAIDADGFGALVDSAVTHTADVQLTAEELARGIGEIIGIRDVADAIAKLRQRRRPALGGMRRGNVVTFAEYA